MIAAFSGQTVWRWLLVSVLWGGVLTGCAPNPAQVEVVAAEIAVTPEAWRAEGRTFSYREQTVFYRTDGSG